MKILLCLAMVLLFVIAPLHAQTPVVELPELEEWYSVSGVGLGISYLPGFSSNGGMNTIVIATPNGATWYNRFAYDTVNQFSWSPNYGSEIVNQGDFNGDGIMDYMDLYGYIYKGIEKNQPPERTPVIQYKFELFSSWRKVLDINNDGYDDIIIPCREGVLGGTPLFVILLGNKDFTKMQMITINDKVFKNNILIGAFMNQEGKARVITYKLDSLGWEGFVLYSLDFLNGGIGENLQVSLKLLDNIGEYLPDKTKPKYKEYASSEIYYNKQDKQAALLIPHGSLSIYSIEQDKFHYKYDNPRTTAKIFPFQTSIDGSGKQAWGRLSWDILFYTGNPTEDTIPKAKFGSFYNNKTTYASRMVGIGDVTGDGVGDIAINYEDLAGSGSNDIVIVKGISPTAVNEGNNKHFFTMGVTEPNPIGMSRIATLPINLEKYGHYILTISDSNGKMIGELFSGELPVGEQRLSLTLKSFNLSSGFYTLRLSDGKNTCEHGILITNQP